MTPKQAAERILELDKTLYRVYNYEMSRIDPGYIEISNLAPQVAKALLEAIGMLEVANKKLEVER